MGDKYQISKNKEPETRQEIIQHQIEELSKRQDKETKPAAKKALNENKLAYLAQYIFFDIQAACFQFSCSLKTVAYRRSGNRLC